MKGILASLALGVAALAMAAAASAQAFPSKPIRMIIPYVPGGALDASARAVGQSVSESIGQPSDAPSS